MKHSILLLLALCIMLSTAAQKSHRTQYWNGATNETWQTLNGEMHGLYTKRYMNGKVEYTNNYANGQLHGITMYYFDNATVCDILVYEKGDLVKHTEYFYYKGKRTIKSIITYDSSGNERIKQKFNYETGKLFTVRGVTADGKLYVHNTLGVLELMPYQYTTLDTTSYSFRLYNSYQEMPATGYAPTDTIKVWYDKNKTRLQSIEVRDSLGVMRKAIFNWDGTTIQ